MMPWPQLSSITSICSFNFSSVQIPLLFYIHSNLFLRASHNEEPLIMSQILRHSSHVSPAIYYAFIMSCSVVISYLYSCLCQVNLQRELLSGINIRVVRLSEHALQLLQLGAREGGPDAALLPLLVQTGRVREELIRNCGGNGYFKQRY